MSLLAFFGSVVLVSLSGVMAPGPITAVTIGHGTRSPHSGALVGVGHGLVEFPLIALLFFGLSRFFEYPYVRAGLTGAGGVILVVLAVDMLRQVRSAAAAGTGDQGRTPLVSGMLLTAANPYFLVWWITIGAALLAGAVAFGPWMVLAFAVVHWLCDFVWLYALSFLSFNGKRFFGAVYQRIAFGTCGVFLLAMSVKFFVDCVRLVNS
jgi:threonine/homoserine/homoserine lactone efflux protein